MSSRVPTAAQRRSSMGDRLSGKGAAREWGDGLNSTGTMRTS
jgi:hypothetical protein